MMHRCSSDGHGNNMVGNGGPCCCGFFHSQNSPIPASPFSMIFSHKGGSCNNEGDLYSFASPAVDCTLSLGTPSTRFTSCHDHDHDHDADAEKMIRRSSNNCMSSNYLFHSNSHINQSPYTTSRGNANFGGGGETLLARRCANCDTTSTPLWRNGPKGPKSLCNACGIRYKKEERRATATAAAATGSGADSTLNNNSWVQHSQNQKASYMSNEFRFIQEKDDSTAGGIPFLSWRLNVTDRAGLIHNLTSI